MKQKDWALIVVVMFVSAIMSYFISSKLFSAPKDRKTSVEVVEAISADLKKPDERYFNANSIDPTQLIQIGNQNNQQPF